MAGAETRPLSFGVFTPPIARPDSDLTWAVERMPPGQSHELLKDRVAPHVSGASARRQQNFQHIATLNDDWSAPVREAQRAVTERSRT